MKNAEAKIRRLEAQERLVMETLKEAQETQDGMLKLMAQDDLATIQRQLAKARKSLQVTS